MTKNNSQSESQPNRAGSEDEFISALLKRQDSVLERLDELNLRIEKAIEEIGKARQESSDITEQSEAEEAAKADQANQADGVKEPNRVELPVSKAA